MENKKSNKLEIVIAIAVLVLAIGAVVLFKSGVLSKNTGTDEKKGQYHVEVNIVDESQDFSKTYYYDTDEKTLGDLLEKEDLIGFENGDYGRYVTAADGIKADDSKEQWWSVAVNGEDAQTGIDGINIKDGDKYKLELKTGY